MVDIHGKLLENPLTPY